ncbi:MAG TPA: DoxX family protein [Myxococcaceae bacterium]|nr:DoxX family protein [Myxococcaceae bacterium]
MTTSATAVPPLSVSAVRARRLAYWTRTGAYWLFTLLVASEMVAGAFWDLLRVEYVRVVLSNLGYPEYLLLILGIGKLPCAVALLVPGFTRLKEWAYAGAFFNYAGAAASHYLVGDRAAKWVGPLVFVAFTMLSWALRPEERKAPRRVPAAPARPVAWIVPLVIVGLLMIISLATLPVGPPPP